MESEIAVDVVVVGAGYAGVRAAIAAHDAGAKVMILEKMSHPGGISIMSGGAVLCVEEEAAARVYFGHMSGGRASEEMVASFASGLAGNMEDVKTLAEPLNASFLVRNRPGIYPFPGREGLNSVIITRLPGFNDFPWYPGPDSHNGALLMALLLAHMETRKIPVKYNIAAQRLTTNAAGQIAGLVAQSEGQQIHVAARKAVILACGGFEFDEWVKLQYLETKPFYAMGSPANTGDGLRMAQAVGARLWHMWHTHNSYGFKYDEFPMSFRHFIGGSLMTHGALKQVRKMPWIVVDTFGRRFMNEYPPAPQDTGARPLPFFDPGLPGYPRIPCYLIFDSAGKNAHAIAVPLGYPEHFPGGERYRWSADNSKEVEKGWIMEAGSLEELAARIKNMHHNEGRMQADLLAETVEEWNKAVLAGKDGTFNRHPETMMAIKTPPFYAMEAWPLLTNTQGGPEHNIDRQVLDVCGKAIPRLYTAGELGSFFGHIYELSGNIGECFSSGRIAGAAAAGEAPLW
jgi:succinate dehydrogenase/fumarate reductase flavoprotein subunit